MASRQKQLQWSGRALAVIAIRGTLCHMAHAAELPSAVPAGKQGEVQKDDASEIIVVTGKDRAAYGTAAQTRTTHADLGPLGDVATLDTPFAVTTVPRDVIANQQSRNLSDLFQYLPSVQDEARGGANIGRPQSRGFESDVVSNTRIDGLNAVETTPYAAEQFDSLTVLNGLAGALYGPQNPAGIFEYELKRPVASLHRVAVDYDSLGVVTEHVDFSGRAGNNDWFGWRINALHGDGTTYVAHSNLRRNLISGDFDIRLTPDTTIEIDTSQYTYHERGTEAGFAYSSTLALPAAPDVSRPGYGQAYSGFDAETDTGIAKIRHRFSADWNLTLGGLYQVADRDVFTNANTFTDAAGDYTQTIAAAATARRFIVGSNLGYLNGHVVTGPITHDVVFGTNGFRQGNYNPMTAQTIILGRGSLADPQPLPGYQPRASGIYRSAQSEQQALIAGDTLHLGSHWSVMGVFSWSYLSSTNYGKTGAVTSNFHTDGAFSPTTSLIYKPVENQTAYFTYGNSIQLGDTAPVGAANQNVVLPPYRSEEFEVGYKIDLGQMRLQAAGFRITRPFAFTNPVTNVFTTDGIQRNYGVEFLSSGHLTPALGVLGGVTWIDPELGTTSDPRTSNKRVVGVPPVQFNMLLDYTMPAAESSLLHGLAFTANVHYTARRAANVYNTTSADGYVTLNLGARYAFHVRHTPLVARVEIDNVTNERYWLSVYPSSLAGAINATNSAYAGLPRTAQASLEADF